MDMWVWWHSFAVVPTRTGAKDHCRSPFIIDCHRHRKWNGEVNAIKVPQANEKPLTVTITICMDIMVTVLLTQHCNHNRQPQTNGSVGVYRQTDFKYGNMALRNRLVTGSGGESTKHDDGRHYTRSTHWSLYGQIMLSSKFRYVWNRIIVVTHFAVRWSYEFSGQNRRY